MSVTRTVNGSTYHVKCNRIPRPLMAGYELPGNILEEQFGYIENVYSDDGEAWLVNRFFNYRGSWYDTYEFERAGDDVKALGFDGVQTESYFSAVAVSYFDRDGYEYDTEIVVGYIHW